MARDGPTLEDIEEARIAYHGIWWKTAGKTCSVERFKTLVDTVGDALWLAKATVNMLEVEAPESEAWDLYMGLASVWEVREYTDLPCVFTLIVHLLITCSGRFDEVLHHQRYLANRRWSKFKTY